MRDGPRGWKAAFGNERVKPRPEKSRPSPSWVLGPAVAKEGPSVDTKSPAVTGLLGHRLESFLA